MKPADIRKQIKNGETAPLYLLEGDDLQSRHDLGVEFANVVDEGLQAFNVQSFHAIEAGSASARDALIGDILSAARTLPMMAPRRVLIVQDADRLLSPRKAKDEETEPPPAAKAVDKRRKALSPAEELEEYFASPEPMTTLVFVAGDMDANRRLVKLLRKHAVGVDCGSLESAADAAKWMQKRLEKDGLTIEPQAVSLILETTGLNLGRIRAEIDKLALYAAEDKAVTARHVQELVLPQSDPGEYYALSNAISNNNAAEALRQIATELDTGKPAFMVLGLIRIAAGKLKPDDRARRALDAVFQADLAIKSSMGEPQCLLERLAIEICSRR